MQVFLPTVLLFGLLSSCSDDVVGSNIGANGGHHAHTSGVYHFVFNIDTGASDSQTRTTWKDATDEPVNGDLVYGTADEHAIASTGNYALFFNNENKLVAVTDLSLLKPELNSGNNNDPEKIEKLYTTKLYATDDDFPQAGWSVLIVLNGAGLYSELQKYADEGKTEANVLGHILKNTTDPTQIGFYTANNTHYFVMTNSIYVDKDNSVFASVPITEKMIHEEEKKELQRDEILTVHVERMVSKFSVTFENSESETLGEVKRSVVYTPDVTEDLSQNHQVNICTGWEKVLTYIRNDGEQEKVPIVDWQPRLEKRNWKAEIVGWGMNALETQSHLFKNIKQNVQYFSDWNAPDYYRSYWAEDPHYEEDYPWQYRWAVDRDLNWYGPEPSDYPRVKKPTDWENLLVNYPWNDNVHLGHQSGEIIYTPENTYDSKYLLDRLDGRTDLLAGTHLIVRARLWVQKSEDSEEYELLEPLYRDRAGVCYTTAKHCLWGLVRSFNWALATQTKLQYPYYEWDSNKNESITLYAVPSITYSGDEISTDENGNFYLYKLYYKEEELTYEYIFGDEERQLAPRMSEDDCAALLAEANIKDGDGKRLLKTDGFSIKRKKADGTTEELPIYSQYDIGVRPVEEERVSSDRVSLGMVTTFEEYDNREFLLNRTETQKQNDIQSLVFEWAGAVDYYKDGRMYYAAPPQVKPQVGTQNPIYGAVRNAWCKFKIQGINNVGIPVHDETMPIVPNWDNPFDQINVDVHVLDWHEFNFSIFGTPF